MAVLARPGGVRQSRRYPSCSHTAKASDHTDPRPLHTATMHVCSAEYTSNALIRRAKSVDSRYDGKSRYDSPPLSPPLLRCRHEMWY